MDWQQALFARRPSGVRLGLDRVEAVWAALGRPGQTAFVFQIVGTNGKGSTAAMLAHGLRAHGHRVGLFTSPHLHRIGERVRVDGQPVADELLAAATAKVFAGESAVGVELSFFEVLTVAALEVFAAAGVEVIVLEAGLGGRLDATSVVSARVHLVTPIDIDHTHYLGDTIEQIAAEKLAVLARGVPALVSCEQREVVRALALARAREVGADLHFVGPAERSPAGLPGPHQRGNAGLALAALAQLDPSALLEDLDGVRWPGRFEWVGGGGEARICFDVAHNLHGLAALLAAMEDEGTWERPPAGPRALIFGCTADKRPELLLARIRPWAARHGATLWLVSPPREGGMDAEALAEAGEQAFGVARETELLRALDRLRAAGGEALVCGSHSVVALLRAHALNIPAGGRDAMDLSDPMRRG